MQNLFWLPYESDSLADAALAYASNGWAVFPHIPRDKLPLIAGGNGFHDATTDLDRVAAWWKREPRANIGVAVPPGHVVLDVDGDEGIAERGALEKQNEPLPFCTRQLTGGGGEVPLSSAYSLVVEHGTFDSGKPCILIAMFYVAGDEPQLRGHMRFDRKSIPSVLEAIERVWRAM